MTSNHPVILTGATGEIGIPLAHKLMSQNYELIIFSRDPIAAKDKIPGAKEYVRWNLEEDSTAWSTYVENACAVINCAGVNMFSQRYSGAFARQVVSSRIQSTRLLVEAIAAARVKPAVFINSSSVGYYGFAGLDDRPVDETFPAGQDHWGRESAAIEAEAFKAETDQTRVVIMRTSYVLDHAGGGLPEQIGRVQKGQGGATTPTQAWRPWIHIEDEVNLFLFALETERVRGALNCTAPDPVTSAEFANALNLAVLGKPATGKFPGWLLKLFMGPAADIITHSKRVVPRKALELGFQFRFPTLESALADLVPKIMAAKSAVSKNQGN